MSNDDDAFYVADKSRIDKSPREQCYLCGKDADLKIGVWDRLKVMTYDDEHAWRMFFICHGCNEKEKYVDVESVWNHIGY
ncbi:MAG: hypothetical protein ACREBB_07580 [Nitrosotalea sp.]